VLDRPRARTGRSGGSLVSGQEFLTGVNLPWIDYGGDFGANAWSPQGGLSRPEARGRLQGHLEGLARSGVRCMRWFLFCDGRAGLRFGRDGVAMGLDPFVLDDLDVAVEVAHGNGIRLIFVLLDFLWFAPARHLRGAQMGGHAAAVRNERSRRQLLDEVVQPVLERFGRSETVLAWDVVNEPEWAVRSVRRWSPRHTVSRAEMRALIGDVVKRVHHTTVQAATVGSAGARGLALVRGLDLDFYQLHWYDTIEAEIPLGQPVAALDLDRPVLLGEFPTRGSARAPSEILQTALRSGYAGALAWSALAEDRFSDGAASQILGATLTA